MQYRISNIDPQTLKIDHRAQRSLLRPHADTIARKFDPRKVGAIIVSERANGDWYILDGQHRATAARDSGYKGIIPAVIHEGLSIEDEAELFLSLNETKIVHPIAKFRSKVTAGRELAVGVNKVVRDLGFNVGEVKQAEKNIAAVSTLEKIYTDYGADALSDTLTTLEYAWPDLPKESRGAQFLSALGFVVGAVDCVDIDHLANRLKATTAGNIMADAQFLADLHKQPKTKVLQESIIVLYNKGLRKDRQVSAPE